MRQDHLWKIGRILRERLHYGLAERFSLVFPVALQLVGRVLHVNRHYVLAVGRERGIGQGRNSGFEIGLMREIAVLRFVESAFEIVDLGTDVNASFEGGPVSVFQSGESWQGGEGEVDFRDRAVAAVML